MLVRVLDVNKGAGDSRVNRLHTAGGSHFQWLYLRPRLYLVSDFTPEDTGDENAPSLCTVFLPFIVDQSAACLVFQYDSKIHHNTGIVTV